MNLKINVVIVIIISIAKARYLNTNANMATFKRQKGWLFLDRMSFDEGLAQVTLKTKLTKMKQIKRDQFNSQLHIIPEQLWAQQMTFKCNRNAETFNLNNLDKLAPTSTILSLPIRLLKQNDFEDTISAKIPLSRPTTFHFVFKDCSRSFVKQVWRKQTRLEFNIQLKNGQLQHGSDEKINSILLPSLILITIFLIYFITSHQLINQELNKKDWGKILLLVTLIFNLIGIVFYWIGHILYVSLSGRFYGAFDFMYLLFHSISQAVLTTLIIFIAFGWTITFVEDAQFDLYVPLISMLGILNLILTLLGKINDGSSDKYHMYDTVPSYLLVFFRVVSVSIFIFGVIRSIVKNKKDKKITDFFFKFSLLGSVYFLSLPAIMIFAEITTAQNRKIYVFVIVELTKNIINAVITWMVSSKKSTYFKAKMVNRSFMEQGTKLL